MNSVSSSIRKFFHSKLKSSFGKKGQNGEENVRSSRVKTVINEEYKKAFRTKSYTDICEKIQVDHIEASLDDDANSFSSSPTAAATDQHVHLSEYLVELRRETLVIGSSENLHNFLTNYFDISLEAGKICESTLHHAHQLRDNHRVIRRVINFIEQKPDFKIWSHNQQNRIHRNLESFATANPFSSMATFDELHDIHLHLLDQLTSKTKKSKKKKKRIMKWIKKALAIIGCGALAVAFLLLALHTAVGVAAAGPGLIASSMALLAVKKSKRSKRETDEIRVAGQIEVAGKGIYAVMNEFETMRQLVQRLHDETEHWKSAAETGVRTGKKEALKQVVRGFKMHEGCFLEQMEELEKQICLCFLHINRSRRLLLQAG